MFPRKRWAAGCTAHTGHGVRAGPRLVKVLAALSKVLEPLSIPAAFRPWCARQGAAPCQRLAALLHLPSLPPVLGPILGRPGCSSPRLINSEWCYGQHEWSCTTNPCRLCVWSLPFLPNTNTDGQTCQARLWPSTHASSEHRCHFARLCLDSVREIPGKPAESQTLLPGHLGAGQGTSDGW